MSVRGILGDIHNWNPFVGPRNNVMGRIRVTEIKITKNIFFNSFCPFLVTNERPWWPIR
jgi:hypothetical protein